MESHLLDPTDFNCEIGLFVYSTELNVNQQNSSIQAMQYIQDPFLETAKHFNIQGRGGSLPR